MTNLQNQTYKMKKEQLPKITKLSKKTKVSKSQFVRDGIDNHIKLHEKGTN